MGLIACRLLGVDGRGPGDGGGWSGELQGECVKSLSESTLLYSEPGAVIGDVVPRSTDVILAVLS